MPEITVVINAKTGEVKIDGTGFSGPECLEKLAPLASAIGTTTHMEAKPEFYEDSNVTASQHISLGR